MDEKSDSRLRSEDRTVRQTLNYSQVQTPSTKKRYYVRVVPMAMELCCEAQPKWMLGQKR